MPDNIPETTAEQRIFIGHGHSLLWIQLKDFIQDRLRLGWEEFNREAVAGIVTSERLECMLSNCVFAFLVMTAEDEGPDSTFHARPNVIHEIGLFQGRLGPRRAIVMVEEGCSEFSNISGLSQIRFPRGNIGACFEEVRRVLEREGLRNNVVTPPQPLTHVVLHSDDLLNSLEHAFRYGTRIFQVFHDTNNILPPLLQALEKLIHGKDEKNDAKNFDGTFLLYEGYFSMHIDPLLRDLLSLGGKAQYAIQYLANANTEIQRCHEQVDESIEPIEGARTNIRIARIKAMVEMKARSSEHNLALHAKIARLQVLCNKVALNSGYYMANLLEAFISSYREQRHG